MLHILLISHEPQAKPGRIGRLLEQRGARVDLHVVLSDPDAPNTDFPDPSQYDAVMAFGSFCNAYDPKARRWVEPEVDFIRDLMHRDIPYLGVCFGGQLLAEALGGEVVPAEPGEKEIGLVTFTESGPIPSGPWFTWHEDRTVLPDYVHILVRNDQAVQLFQSGRAVGTQFHPEADTELVRTWTEVGVDHIPTWTSAEAILGDLDEFDGSLDSNCEELVDWFWHTMLSEE